MKKKPYLNKLDKLPINNKKAKEVDEDKTVTVNLYPITGRFVVVNNKTKEEKETIVNVKKATKEELNGFVDKCRSEWGIK